MGFISGHHVFAHPSFEVWKPGCPESLNLCPTSHSDIPEVVEGIFDVFGVRTLPPKHVRELLGVYSEAEQHATLGRFGPLNYWVAEQR